VARTVTFNGITLIHPGGATKVDVNALAQATLLPTGILGIIGEADGGIPNQVTDSGDPNEGVPKIYVFDEPSNARSVFKSGPLADAINLAFDAANDPRVNNGVNRVYAIKTNQSTRSSVILKDHDTSAFNALELYSIDYGSHTEGITFEISVSASDDNYNKMDITITDTDDTAQDITEVGGAPLIELQYAGPDVPTTLATFANDSSTPASADIINASGDLTGDIDKINAGNWLIITGVSNSPTYDYLLNQVRRVETVGAFGGGKTELTIDRPFFDTADADVTIDGAAFTVTFTVLTEVIGPFEVTSVSETNAPSDTLLFDATPDDNSTPLINRKTRITSDLAGAGYYSDDANGPNYVRIISGPGAGQIREILTGGLNGGDNLEIVISTVDDVGFDPPPTDRSKVMFINVSKTNGGARATVNGASGKASSLDVALAPGFGEKNAAGTVVALGGAGSMIGNKRFDLQNASGDGYSVQQVVNWINNGSNLNSFYTPISRTNYGYKARVGSGRLQTTLANTLDFDTTNQDVDLVVGFDLPFKNTFGVDSTPIEVTPEKRYRLLDNLQSIVDAINASSSVILANRRDAAAGEGSGVPELNQLPSVLTGGTAGSTSSIDILNAFDQLMKVRHDLVVPLFSSDTSTLSIDTVHQATLSHCQLGQGAGKNECHGYLGLDVSVDSQPNSNANALNQLLDAQAKLNSDRVSLGYQRVERLNADGVPTMFEPHMYAVIAAGLKAAGGVGEPSTFKFIKALSIDFPLQLDPADRTVSNELLLNGIHFVENVEGSGFRVVRGLNTYTRSDNLAYTDESVTQVLDYIAYDLRTGIENRFTGLKATPATAASIKSFTVDKMVQYKNEEFIVDSTDPVTGARVNAFRNIRVTISGDIATLRLELFPVIGINFELIEIFAQLPTISA